MSDSKSIDYASVVTGYVIASTGYTFLKSDVDAYLGATGDDAALYRDSGIIPPMAVAALAMGAISDNIAFPEGAVHVSQQMQFGGAVKVGDSVNCTSKVLGRRRRGQFNMLTLGIDISNEDGKPVYSGRTSVLLPQQEGEANV